jgi:hypothetical protein
MTSPENPLILTSQGALTSLSHEAGKLLAKRGLSFLHHHQAFLVFAQTSLIADSPILRLRRLVSCGENDDAFDLAEVIGRGPDVAAATEALGLMLRIAASDDGYYAAKVSLNYNMGTPPFCRDYSASAKWAQLSANKGSRLGEGYLAWLYEIGRGIPQDEKLSMLYSRRSIDQGNTYRLEFAAKSYRFGIGTEVDLARSHAYFHILMSPAEDAESTHYITEEGRGYWSEIEGMITPEDRRRSQEIVKQWKLCRARQ